MRRIGFPQLLITATHSLNTQIRIQIESRRKSSCSIIKIKVRKEYPLPLTLFNIYWPCIMAYVYSSWQCYSRECYSLALKLEVWLPILGMRFKSPLSICKVNVIVYFITTWQNKLRTGNREMMNLLFAKKQAVILR
jgi:hypothetical protein